MINWVAPETLVVEALHVMKALNVSYVIVLKEGSYKGVFCERGYARDIVLRGLKSNSTTVQEVMTIDFPVVRPGYTVEDCRRLLNIHQSGYLLAFDDDDRFLDVVTIEDVLKYLRPEPEPQPLPITPRFHLPEY